MEPRVIRIGRTVGTYLPDAAALLAIAGAAIFARALPWIIGTIANG